MHVYTKSHEYTISEPKILIFGKSISWHITNTKGKLDFTGSFLISIPLSVSNKGKWNKYFWYPNIWENNWLIIAYPALEFLWKHKIIHFLQGFRKKYLRIFMIWVGFDKNERATKRQCVLCISSYMKYNLVKIKTMTK